MESEERPIDSDDDMQEKSSATSDSAGKLFTGDKRLRRMQQNRENSRNARVRKKQRIDLLEQRVAALSAEAEQLRRAVELTVPGYVDNTFHVAFNFLMTRLAKELEDPLTTDQDINSLFQRYIELVGAQGRSRIETLSRTFKATVDLMFPKEQLFWLWLSKLDAQHAAPLWGELSVTLRLSQDQLPALQGIVSNIAQELKAAQRTYRDTKQMVGLILEEAMILQNLITQIRSTFAPKQGGRFALWVNKYYTEELDTEKVLGYGDCVMDFLRLDN